MPVIEKRTAGLRADLAKSRELRFAAETAAKDMRASQVRLADQQGQLRRMETERRIAARGFTSSASLEADRATALGEKARDIVDLMSKLESAGDLRDELAALPGPSLRPAAPGKTATPARDQATTSPASPAYRLPVVGSVVTGMGELSDSGIRSRGLTIAAQASAQIIAPAGGHVAFAGPYRGFGKIVIIDHGHGWTTLITDMAELSVDAGGTVAQGDPLGVASKGRPKITVELRRNSRPIDIVALVNAG
jgi:septal ring factor EnvC (AmiA/AmiB activator)